MAEFVVISATGALSPGPLTFAVAREGLKRGWRAGIEAAAGHCIVELPLLLLISTGLALLVGDGGSTLGLIGIVGGVAMILYGALSLASLRKSRGHMPPSAGLRGVALGAVLSAFNPYFLMWWLTAGLKLVADVVSAGGLVLLVAVYPLHLSLDISWLTAVALMAGRGSGLSERWVTALEAALALALLYSGALTLIDSTAKFQL